MCTRSCSSSTCSHIWKCYKRGSSCCWKMWCEQHLCSCSSFLIWRGWGAAFWFLPAQDLPTGRGWKWWKAPCNRAETQEGANSSETGILGNTLPKELGFRWRPCSIWGGAGWGACPIKSKPETLQFHWKLLPAVLFFKRIFGKKREKNISQLSNASKVHLQQTLHSCVFILGIFWAGLAPRCAQWQSPSNSRYPTSSWAVPDQHKCSQHVSKRPVLDSVRAGTWFWVSSCKIYPGSEAEREERRAGKQAGFSTFQNSPLVFQRTQRLLWPAPAFVSLIYGI